MIKLNIFSLKKEIKLNKEIDKKIKIAWSKALKDPYPNKNSILNYVFSKKN